MASLVTRQQCFIKRTKEEEQVVEESFARYRQVISTLPKEEVYPKTLRQYQGCWLEEYHLLPAVMWMQEQFKSRSTDVLLVTTPKSGTTWLKALIFSIMNRHRYPVFPDHPLLTTSPHDCVPFLEGDLFYKNPIGDPQVLPSPRLLATHVAHNLLPESVINSGCPIVYLCRNPKDVLVSFWHFINRWGAANDLPPTPLEEFCDSFCQGVSFFGPFWDHVLGYWKASLEAPKRMLFLKYEEVKSNPTETAKKLAEFLGCGFSMHEEGSGVVQGIVDLCSFGNMRNVEAKESGIYHRHNLKNDAFYRQGEVGDWVNHLTSEMIHRIDQITEQKFSGFELVL